MEIMSSPVPGWTVGRNKAGIEVFKSPEGIEYVRGTLERCELLVEFPTQLGLQPLYLRKLTEQSKQRLQSVCPRHRLYQAKRKPRTNCETCWEAYNGKT